jgi:lipopolysaccharide export system permease protein
MLQNKIYRNFIKEILKTFFVILFGLTIIAWTVRAVNFLDLIVESGYSITTYFQYSILNLLSILTKFIPLSFLLSLIIFIIKKIQEKEFTILWTSGIKKLKLVNLFFLVSIFILFLYLIFSTFITPMALQKSRSLLNKENFDSFLPTIRIQQFSDSFQGFTFFVEKKKNNKIENVFIYDESNVLKNLTSDQSDKSSTTIVAKDGVIQERKKLILFNGQIISTQKENLKNSVIKFEQLNINLENLSTDTIKTPKLQETPTYDLLQCIFQSYQEKILNCKKSAEKEIKTVLNRRFVLPFYIPIISLLCSFLMIRIEEKKNYFLNKYTIFSLSFFILLYAELIVRYTGISKIINVLFMISPLILIPIIYLLLIYKFSKESIYQND